MPKTKEFEREDGTKGVEYSGEEGEEVISRFSAVGTNERAVIKDGKPTIIKNHYLGVVTKDGQEVTYKITQGQKKTLDPAGDLQGKTITFYTYKNDFGTFIGAKVKQ